MIVLELRGEQDIQQSSPTAFSYKGKADLVIVLKFPELTWKCKKQGYPDFATITVKYVPDRKVLELKSFKLWLNHFRDRYVSYEEISNEIFETLWNLLSPKYLKIHLNINPRGNMKSDIYVERSR